MPYKITNRSLNCRALTGFWLLAPLTGLLAPRLAHAQSTAAAAPPGPSPAADAAPPKPELITEVSVVGTKVERTAGSAHVVRNKDLERMEDDDPAKVLQAVPGVYARGEDGFGLRNNIGMRGTSSDRSKKVALMEDGVPFGPAPYSAPAAYYFPVMTRMTQVRVIKGPGAIVYGPQTIGGALDLITRPIPGTPSGGVDIAGGEYGYAKVHGYYGGGDEHNGVLLEGIHLQSTGFKELNGGANTGFYRNELMFKGHHVFNPNSEYRQELKLKLTYSEEVSNETYLGLSDQDFRNNPLQRYPVTALDQMKNHRTSAVITHVMHPTRGMTVTTNAYRHDFHRIWRKVNRFRGANLFDVLSNADSSQYAVYAAILAGQADTANGTLGSGRSQGSPRTSKRAAGARSLANSARPNSFAAPAKCRSMPARPDFERPAPPPPRNKF